MYFSKAVVVLSVALSAFAHPHMVRSVNHHAVARRAPVPVAEPAPVVAAPKKVRKRSDSSRCIVRSSATSSTAAATSSIVPPKNVESSPAASSVSTSTPTSTSVKETPTTSTTPKETPTTTKKATTTKTSAAAAPTTSSSSSSSASDPLGILTGTHSGDGTFYATGLGACGITNTDTDFIAAVSHELFDNYPGYNGVNPNNNPLCGRKINVQYGGASITITATDRCTGCALFDLDFSPSAFDALADPSIGRLHGVTWEWA